VIGPDVALRLAEVEAKGGIVAVGSHLSHFCPASGS
jgi:hypothetical protein